MQFSPTRVPWYWSCDLVLVLRGSKALQDGAHQIYYSRANLGYLGTSSQNSPELLSTLTQDPLVRYIRENSKRYGNKPTCVVS